MATDSPTPPPKRPLKGKKLAFAIAYLKLPPGKGRITQAAENAGVPRKGAARMGSKWLKMADVAAYVGEREAVMMEKIEKDQLVTREWIVEQLKGVYTQCLQGEPHLVWDADSRAFVPSGEWKFDSRGANKSLELLGRCINMFNEKGAGVTEPFNLVINLGEPAPSIKTIEHEPAQLPPPVTDITGLTIDL